jgi:hypothetical protein
MAFTLRLILKLSSGGTYKRNGGSLLMFWNIRTVEILGVHSPSVWRNYGALNVSENLGCVAKIVLGHKDIERHFSSSGALEEIGHESNLSANVALPDSFNLSLRDHGLSASCGRSVWRPSRLFLR